MDSVLLEATDWSLVDESAPGARDPLERRVVARTQSGTMHLADRQQDDGAVLTLCGNLIVRPYPGIGSGVMCPICVTRSQTVGERP
jgi:hypothetical protein